VPRETIVRFLQGVIDFKAQAQKNYHRQGVENVDLLSLDIIFYPLG
jgi:hypothetical protein